VEIYDLVCLSKFSDLITELSRASTVNNDVLCFKVGLKPTLDFIRTLDQRCMVHELEIFD
jgi:hypothetical protein